MLSSSHTSTRGLSSGIKANGFAPFTISYGLVVPLFFVAEIFDRVKP